MLSCRPGALRLRCAQSREPVVHASVLMPLSTADADADSFAAHRQTMRDEFFGKLFLLGGFLGGTDTYKRTMWAAVPDIAVQQACYTLTMRKGLPEPGA